MQEESLPSAPRQTGFFTRDSLPRIAPFAAYMAFIAVADLLHRFGWTAQEMLWLYPLKIATVVALLFAWRGHYQELSAVRPGRQGLVAAIVVGVVVFVLWINLDASWMQVGESAGYDPTRGDGSLDWLLIGCRLAGAALVVPVMEELFWRSFLQRWVAQPDFLNCRPAMCGIRALVIASVLFGIEHNLWFAGVIAGLAYGWLYMRTNNLWLPVVAHAVTNGLLGAWVVATGSWSYW